MTIRYWLIIPFLALLPLSIFAQKITPIMTEAMPASVEFAQEITAEEMREILTVLASDEYEGRETGTAGQRKAADYIAGLFKEMGMPAFLDGNSYFQEIIFTGENWNEAAIKINDTEYRNMRDFYAFPTRNGSLETTTIDEIIFLGYGIEDGRYSDYAGKDVNGKIGLIYAGEPRDKDGNFLLTKSQTASEWTGDWERKVRLAKEKGVKLLLIVDPDVKKNIAENRRQLLSYNMKLGGQAYDTDEFVPHVYISSTMARDLVSQRFKKLVKARDKIAKKGKLKKVEIPTDMTITLDKNLRQLIGSNVLGYVEGSNPNLKDEVVVVTAHYDHLGARGKSIFNGADDNASGTTTVLEVAESFAAAKAAGVGPRRSVLFMLVSGEEKGLLGSQYYAEFPIFPIEKTVANINVDMVGRVDKKYEDNPNYIYVIGSDRLSTELHEINETANKTYTNLVLDYTYNDDNDPNRYYYRSDHYNFAKKGIPAIFYFNGTHVDYHRPSDTVDKINFEKMEKIGRLVFHTTWELANRDKRIEVDVKGRN
ncbi:MAG: M28 family peptidase [Bacteroidota bacterium]